MTWTDGLDQVLSHWKIRSLGTEKNGDTWQMIYLKLVSLAAKVGSSGYIHITPSLPFSDKALAMELGKHIITVRKALAVLENYGLLERISGGFLRITMPEFLPKEAPEEERKSAQPTPVTAPKRAAEPPAQKEEQLAICPPQPQQTAPEPTQAAQETQPEETAENNEEKVDKDMPFDLQQSELESSMKLFAEVEQIAKSVGLPCNEFSISQACMKARTYGMEKFRQAAEATARIQSPNWNYFNAVILGTGRRPDTVNMRQVYGAPNADPPGKWYKPGMEEPGESITDCIDTTDPKVIARMKEEEEFLAANRARMKAEEEKRDVELRKKAEERARNLPWNKK